MLEKIISKLTKKRVALILLAGALLTLIFLIILRQSHIKANNNQIITVTPEPYVTHLFYAGNLQPLRATPVTSHLEGRILEVLFNYGDMVHKGDVLLTLHSEKIQHDYEAALMQFLHAKTEFNTSEMQFKQAEFLRKNQLISRDEFKMRQASFYNTRLVMLQAKYLLTKLLKSLHKSIDIDKLEIKNIAEIAELVKNDTNPQPIPIVAEYTGIILSPSKNNEYKKMEPGDFVKEGEVIARINEDNKLAVQIGVSELNINQLKVGQMVNLNGDAFPNADLKGKILNINHQAESNQTSVPQFPVMIVLNPLTAEQQKHIHTGMSVKVEIDISQKDQVLIPINAVSQHDGESYIRYQDKKTGKIIEFPVKTDQTTLDQVAVDKKYIGDKKIVLPSKAS